MIHTVVCHQGNAGILVLAVCSAAIGGTLQYGYNIAIINAPTIVRPPTSAIISVTALLQCGKANV